MADVTAALLRSNTAGAGGTGGTALLFPTQHLWAPHHEVVWIRGTSVNSDRATLEAKHEHQHGLTPS